MTGKELRIVFMGTPDFAVASLQALVENSYNVVGVVTAPDKPAGRGKKLTESAVKKYAVEKNIKVLQPEKLKHPDFLEELKALQPDLQVVVAFRMLPEVVWAMPPLGTFNLHGSLLPQYRGAAPLNWAVINGETKTGVTTFLLDQKIDTGKILFRKEVKIEKSDTVGDIHDRLMEVGAKLVLKTVDALANGKVKPIPQSELESDKNSRPAPKIFKIDCKINWTKDVETVRNLIRGLSPHPAAWANLVHKDTGRTIPCKIFFAQPVISAETATPGTIDSDDQSFLNVACGNGWLEITDMQLSGKKRMNAADFLRGFRNIMDYHFE
ncbi:methionyl-tRNA formyltransferase [Tangfeifania diversioriginum]|uniref:Methionyl-tRNA formyltransferase n=1 Tax=Tangfeifania diversioriginum TaxID=1168035 RepID=A0A1M6B897_9BACT|nr:methionyl-tRNA formyltransferase [Tangfeifania diversioriginum]SHI44971.1 methionyl-tRNA formyltransferase [Tangfeifania diversioriginum]